MAKPVFYIMTCSVPGVVKLGKTDTDKYDAEIKKLIKNGYLDVFGWQEYRYRECDTEAEIDAHLLSLEQYRWGSTELYMVGDPIFAILPYPMKPPFNLYKLGIKNGDVLTFAGDPSIKVTVVGEREVEYNGIKYTLSALALKLYEDIGRPFKHRIIRGAAHFMHQGVRLTELPLKN